MWKWISLIPKTQFTKVSNSLNVYEQKIKQLLNGIVSVLCRDIWLEFFCQQKCIHNDLGESVISLKCPPTLFAFVEMASNGEIFSHIRCEQPEMRRTKSLQIPQTADSQVDASR